ncbi:MAG: hypothetical protein WD046_07830 [Paracoccaceae bacterium]
MIIFVTTALHGYTIARLRPLPGMPQLRQWSYERLFRTRLFARATYVLTDFDRLKVADIEAAARFYDALQARGLRVLNDPRQFLPRDMLLRHLHRCGVNSFDIWRPGDGETPTRYPVFLRTIAAHRGALSELLDSAGQAETALREALAAGHPIADLVFVEYVGQPTAAGKFEKRAAHMLGDEIFAAPTANQAHWMAKFGEKGAGTPEGYRQELDETRAYPHTETLRRVFKIAGAQYGRADFALRDGRVEVFEVNTNPYFSFSESHPNPDRLQTLEILKTRLAESLRSIDTPRSIWPLSLHRDLRTIRYKGAQRRYP